MADDPDARHACPRYHGPADAYFRRRAAEVEAVLAAEEHPVACPTNPCAYASGT